MSRRAIARHTQPENCSLHPIRLVSFCPLAGLLLLGFTMLLANNTTLHRMCFGGAAGILLGACVFAWQVDEVTLNSAEQPPRAYSHK